MCPISGHLFIVPNHSIQVKGIALCAPIGIGAESHGMAWDRDPPIFQKVLEKHRAILKECTSHEHGLLTGFDFG